jgi:hypothetical protein
MAKTGLQNNASKEVTTLMAPLSFVQDPNKAFDQRRERPHNNIPNGKSDIHKSMSLARTTHLHLEVEVITPLQGRPSAVATTICNHRATAGPTIRDIYSLTHVYHITCTQSCT